MTLPDPRDDKWGGPDIRISEYGLWDDEDENGSDPDVPQTDTTTASYSQEKPMSLNNLRRPLSRLSRFLGNLNAWRKGELSFRQALYYEKTTRRQ